MGVTRTYEGETVVPPYDIHYWLECNVPNWTLGRVFGNSGLPMPGPAETTLSEWTIQAINEVAPICPNVVVTSKPPYAPDLFRRFVAECPRSSILPGLKLWDYGIFSGDWLVDSGMWSELAKDATKVAAICGSNRVLVDAEGPLKPFYRDEYMERGRQPNVRKLYEAMAPLRETGLGFIWYPFGPFPTLRPSLAIYLCNHIVGAVPNSEFTDVAYHWPVTDRDRVERQGLQDDAFEGKIIHHRFVAPEDGPMPGRYVWPSGDSRETYVPVQFRAHHERHSTAISFVFPGGYNAMSTAKGLVKAWFSGSSVGNQEPQYIV